MKERILKPTIKNLNRAAECVKAGGVIIIPSDTNMVLITNPQKESSIERVMRIKDRSDSKPLSFFFLNPDDWSKYAYGINWGLINAVTKRYWPGPLNIVLQKKSCIIDKLVCGMETVSLGCVHNPVWRQFMQILNMPTATTSANRSGCADGILVDLNLAIEQLGEQVDYIVEGQSWGNTMSSTILDLVGEPKILRQGDLSGDEIMTIANAYLSKNTQAIM